ncbi:MAG: hypothetical protein JXR56_00680 [Candidatus Cloacimonetes bacterium]|nr:hypothetical protein [Candidatus Cloacimonadota bacterium]
MRRFLIVLICLVGALIALKLVQNNTTEFTLIEDYEYNHVFDEKIPAEQLEPLTIRYAIEEIIEEMDEGSLWSKIVFSSETTEDIKYEFEDLTSQIAGFYAKNITVTEFTSDEVTPENSTSAHIVFDAEIIPVDRNPYGLEVKVKNSFVYKTEGLSFTYTLEKKGYATILHCINGVFRIVETHTAGINTNRFQKNGQPYQISSKQYSPEKFSYILLIITDKALNLANDKQKNAVINRNTPIVIEDIENELRKQKQFSVRVVPYYMLQNYQ